jgi:hypothetical protein
VPVWAGQLGYARQSEEFAHASAEIAEELTFRLRIVDTLMDSVSGRFLFRTEAGTEYLIDLDRKTLTRVPYVVEAAPALTAQLRRDYVPVELLRIYDCTVGRSAHFALNLGEATGVTTLRSTSPVESIDAEAGSVE